MCYWSWDRQRSKNYCCLSCCCSTLPQAWAEQSLEMDTDPQPTEAYRRRKANPVPSRVTLLEQGMEVRQEMETGP